MNVSSWQTKMSPAILLLIIILVGACNLPVEVEQTPVKVGEAGVAGRLWHDECAAPGEGQSMPEQAPVGCISSPNRSGYVANGRLDPNETGIGGVEVSLGQGACPSFGLATTDTEQDGVYLFTGLQPGSYCISIDPNSSTNASILLPGAWSYPEAPQAKGVVSTQVELGEAQVRADVYFAWDYDLLPPYEAPTAMSSATETTAPAENTPTSTATPESTGTSTATPAPEISPTPTPGADDPRTVLSDPTWVDGFDNQSDWALYSDDHARFNLVDDGLQMTAVNPDFFNSWVLSWRKAEDLYLEAIGTFDTCSGRDSFGLMIRSTGGSKGYIGYLFGISCDGRYSLRSWDGESMSTIVGWTGSGAIRGGAGQTNRVGIKADGSKFSLYANGEFLVQVNDTRHQGEGLFGLFVSAAQTADFTTVVEEIAFWDLD